MDQTWTEYQLRQVLEDSALLTSPASIVLAVKSGDTPGLRTRAKRLAGRAAGAIQLWKIQWGLAQGEPFDNCEVLATWPG